MHVARAVTVGIAAALIGASTAQAATTELSVTTRLQDRREVAPGSAAYAEGFEDGALLRQRLAHHRRDGRRLDAAAEARSTASGSASTTQWVGPATKFTSGWGYTRFDLPDMGGLQRRSAPTSCPTAAAPRCSG